MNHWSQILSSVSWQAQWSDEMPWPGQKRECSGTTENSSIAHFSCASSSSHHLKNASWSTSPSSLSTTQWNICHHHKKHSKKECDETPYSTGPAKNNPAQGWQHIFRLLCQGMVILKGTECFLPKLPEKTRSKGFGVILKFLLNIPVSWNIWSCCLFPFTNLT